VAALILIIGFELAKGSVEKIFSPTPVAFSWALVAVLVLSIGVKLWLSLFNSRLGNMINSPALQATACDSRNDCISTAAVLVAAVLEKCFGWQLDGWFGLGVAVFILLSGVSLAKETISPLLGESANPELRRAIISTISKHELVLGYHDLMVHDYGPGQRFATMHVEMDKSVDPLLCHDIIDDLERQCHAEHGVHLVIHYDPVVTGDKELEATRRQVEQVLQTVDSRITIHDFRMVTGPSHTNLIFDIVLPLESRLSPKEATEAIEKAVTVLDEHGPCYAVVTVDRPMV
jgi:cation diffusion facilitator family transporter